MWTIITSYLREARSITRKRRRSSGYKIHLFIKVKMTAELPSLVIDSPTEEFQQRSASRLNVKSALESHRNKYDQDSDTKESTYKKSKRNSEGHILQVKFAADVTVPANERLKTEVSSLNPALKVDHKHYEQWARVPGKKVANSSLLRGIQQLKAKMIREERNGLSLKTNEKVKELRIFGSPNREFHINQLKRNTLLTREKSTEDSGIRFRREKTSLGIESFSSLKNVFPTRNELKPNSHLIDAGVFKQDKDASVTSEVETRLSRNTERDSAKLRHGMSRIRDRSSLPISVYQPVNIGDHVFLVNEPIKDSELSKLNKTVTKDPRGASMLFLTDKTEENNFLNKAPELTFEMILGGKTDPSAESMQRSRMMIGGHALPPRTQRRPQFMVSSAELYDFSQLSEIRHSMADKLLERSQTDLLFPSRTLRNGYKICNS